MYREVNWFMALLLALGLAACGPADRETGEEVAEEQEDVAEAQLDQSRETFQRTAKSRIEAMEEQADRLGDQIGEMPENARGDLNAQLDDWRQRADDLESRIDNFDPNTPQEWRDFESRASSELDELDRSLNELSQRISTPPTR